MIESSGVNYRGSIILRRFKKNFFKKGFLMEALFNYTDTQYFSIYT